MKYNYSLHTPKKLGKELSYLKNAINEGWFADGKYIEKFSQKINKYTGSKYSVPIVNATSALHISLKVLGIKENDEVIVPTITFIAPINAISYCNANPIFMDCDKYYNIDYIKLEKFLKSNTYNRNGKTFNSKSNNHIKAIIIVHTFGNAADILKLKKICDRYKIKLIEDASESLGTFYKKNYLNSKKSHTGIMGHLGCISFNGNKIISSGGGGIILTQNKQLYEKIKYLINQAKDDKINFVHNEVGYNYRLSNIQAAVCYAQLNKIDFVIKQKKRVRDLYLKKIKDNDKIQLVTNPPYAQNNYWINMIYFKYKIDLNKIVKRLNMKGIFVRPIWQLNHLQKKYKKCEAYDIKNAQNYLINSLCLPSSYHLKKNDIEIIINEILDCI